MRWVLAAAMVAFGVLGGCDEGKQTPGRPAAANVTKADVMGTWVVDPATEKDAAFNAALDAAERAGEMPGDPELEERAKSLIALIRKDAPSYVIKEDGTFTAAKPGGMVVAGTWTLDQDVLTLNSPSTERGRQFRVEPGVLVNLPTHPRGRPTRLIRG